ncbi:DUF6146 family protein [Jejuia pallidilutea]|uniref:Uncharacterized protein n=1 Tax=Jejuia pallidilutea TaxID=504487 RepID=A0A090W5S6_9FLAO|nr:DUF6146 family protein [Jejuia pallidilutea]GAL68659.1 hypothetical protein JCM19301_3246 [Jejuia pallidilutea]GAL72296.1 hypothetical protein JCM19302_41 [Jejuia pallidilutea]GAL89261.1 hypothetical protein JCM19538_3341 [Jejuia pallidilutea]
MKYIIYALLVSVFLFNCNTSKTPATSKKDEKQVATTKNDTVVIANEELEYEIIIIDPGFSAWIVSVAQPRGFYSQQYMETRNQIYVLEFNQRVLQPQRYNPNLYELQIDYQPNIDYGYEVNYMLYNYFIYFQIKYNQRLGPFVPRI